MTEDALSQLKSLRVLTLHNNQLKRLHLSTLGHTIERLSLLDMTGKSHLHIEFAV